MAEWSRAELANLNNALPKPEVALGEPVADLVAPTVGAGAVLEAYRFRRQLYYATCAILVSIPSSYSEGVRYPSPF
jgi:hypothetical protein